MPNWCEGNLKIRGKRKKIIDFINNTLVKVNWHIDEKERKEYPINIVPDEYGEINIETETKENYLYFKDSRRMFPTGEIDIYLDDEEDKEQVIYMGIKQAWKIDIDYLQKLSKENDVDLRIVGYECGMYFVQEIEIVKGNIVRDRVNEYKGNEWIWEIDDPSLGG